MSVQTFGCAAGAALLFLFAAGPAGAAGQTQEAEPIPERWPSVATEAAATVDAAEDPMVRVVRGPVVQMVKRASPGRTLSTYYCRTVSVARVHRTFLGFVA